MGDVVDCKGLFKMVLNSSCDVERREERAGLVKIKLFHFKVIRFLVDMRMLGLQISLARPLYAQRSTSMALSTSVPRHGFATGSALESHK
jgi:hypothetical protein